MRVLLIVFLLMCPVWAFAAGKVSFEPTEPLQGDPLIVSIAASSTADVMSVSFNGTTHKHFLYGGKVQALSPLPLSIAPREYPLEVTFRDGSVERRMVSVAPRPRPQEEVKIPQALGGNTQAAGTRLVSTLARENAILAGLWSQGHILWRKPFKYPVTDTTVTGVYGYDRSSGGQQIAHKGLDFRAPVGTPVYAMNRGVVRLVKNFSTYGKTIVIDHGLGVFTFYMHLSKVYAIPGTLVDRGALIGKSGASGYADGAHLHITVRFGRESIDPQVFMKLMGE